MKRLTAILILVLVTSCKTNRNWEGGEIINFGKFCNHDLIIDVYENNSELNYQVRNHNGEILIQQDMNISSYQQWGLYLDRKKNFWVFSSDVGDGIWEFERNSGQYHKRMFHHQLTKEEVPKEIFDSHLRRFLKN